MAQSYFSQACDLMNSKLFKLCHNEESGEHTGRNLLSEEQNV